MKRIALICLLGLCLQVTAQKNYQKGQVVLTNRDTLKGWIDYRNWHINPTSIRFKQDSLADGARQFTTNDISFFQVAGDKYLKAFITKDMLPVDVNSLAADSTEMQQTETAFLRVLVEGPVLNLYEVYDFKPHYYIQDSTKSYHELTNKITLGVEHPLGDEHNPVGDEHIKMHVHDYYHGELMAYLLLQPKYDKKLARQIQTIGYTEKELGKVVAALNGVTGQNVPYVSNNRKKALSFYAGAGAIYSTLTFSGDNVYLKGMDFGWNTGPAIMAGVELFSDRSFRELSFRLEVAYSSISYKADNLLTRNSVGSDTIHYELKQRNITPSLIVLYHIIRREKFRYYIGAQFAYNLSSYPTNALTATHSYTTIVSKNDSYLSFDKNWPIVNIKTGAIINRRWDVGITGSLWGRNLNTSTMHNNVKQYALWLGYHFL
ncbi:hypothetical protein Niako_5983 [Niastella koreensis GR20-10]|uniref:Outer membrane protein beta-barrel domain-containing protein n=1 Tax=Niastella koreensis (strain DSM 17620 / KACC 11465 / NBRC 106392 / GR20-10) TaxID=700598 RepID=G8TRR5_NIAKG|nr:outer membrane beta-barrel protein [Niastella koreensis]AEW02212.1 hypothetical protein Niako_5983 [Niastella koreensis GR20-10]